MRHMQLISILVLAMLMIGCNEVDPLSLPESSDIAAIEVYEGVLEIRKQTQVITDVNVISDIVGFVKANNSGWHTTWNTYPTPTVTVVFRGKEKGTKMLLWFGPDWVGGHASPISPKKAYLWGLSESKLQEIKSKLGISV